MHEIPLARGEGVGELGGESSRGRVTCMWPGAARKHSYLESLKSWSWLSSHLRSIIYSRLVRRLLPTAAKPREICQAVFTLKENAQSYWTPEARGRTILLRPSGHGGFPGRARPWRKELTDSDIRKLNGASFWARLLDKSRLGTGNPVTGTQVLADSASEATSWICKVTASPSLLKCHHQVKLLLWWQDHPGDG